MELFETLKQKAKKQCKAIVFPEGHSPKIIEAAVRLAGEGLCAPVLLGDPESIYKTAKSIEIDIGKLTVLNPTKGEKLEEYTDLYFQSGGLPERVCRKIISQPINFGAMMVKTGGAHGMVAGIDCPTSDVILASELIIGLMDGVSVSSSFYLMDIPGFRGSEGSMIVFADPAVNPNPKASELADIAVVTAASAQELLGWTPRVAMLSFSTKGSGEHPDVEKVAEAFRLAHQRAPQLLIDGELQADAALIPEIAQKKAGTESAVAGRANVLIFPDLDAANIASKLVQLFAHATACGPILQGFRRPVSDLSRSASVEDIIQTTLFVAARDF